jgi:signal transduction histidine kinase
VITPVWAPSGIALVALLILGLGIGLALVARFAELHGGRTWVEDRAGEGASFRILLPGCVVPQQAA